MSWYCLADDVKLEDASRACLGSVDGVFARGKVLHGALPQNAALPLIMMPVLSLKELELIMMRLLENLGNSAFRKRRALGLSTPKGIMAVRVILIWVPMSG